MQNPHTQTPIQANPRSKLLSPTNPAPHPPPASRIARLLPVHAPDVMIRVDALRPQLRSQPYEMQLDSLVAPLRARSAPRPLKGSEALGDRRGSKKCRGSATHAEEPCAQRHAEPLQSDLELQEPPIADLLLLRVNGPRPVGSLPDPLGDVNEALGVDMGLHVGVDGDGFASHGREGGSMLECEVSHD